jgi:dimeric dUTPase (all-alpha-NTP-PPase superfamily)
MNPTNVCRNLEIVPIDIVDPFKEMYLLQQRLQLRLNLDAYSNITPASAAAKCIYWFYCVASEGKELLDWFDPKHRDTMLQEDLYKEIQMEAIDVLHFVMNIGLELRFTADEVNAVAEEFKAPTSWPDEDKCNMAFSMLIEKCVVLIDCLPWKTWKTYTDDLGIEDIKSLVGADYAMVYSYCLLLACYTGLSKQDIVNTYFAKNAENHARQDNGY